MAPEKEKILETVLSPNLAREVRIFKVLSEGLPSRKKCDWRIGWWGG